VALLTGGAAAKSLTEPYRIGLLRTASADDLSDRFKNRLAELGYLEDRDYVLTNAAYHGQLDRLLRLAADLVPNRSAATAHPKATARELLLDPSL